MRSVLNALQLICDILKCTKENRIGIVKRLKTRADESMSYK
jgi:hypothetical protein